MKNIKTNKDVYMEATYNLHPPQNRLISRKKKNYKCLPIKFSMKKEIFKKNKKKNKHKIQKLLATEDFNKATNFFFSYFVKVMVSIKKINFFCDLLE